jgi:hypothetical protein
MSLFRWVLHTLDTARAAAAKSRQIGRLERENQ